MKQVVAMLAWIVASSVVSAVVVIVTASLFTAYVKDLTREVIREETEYRQQLNEKRPAPAY